MTGGYYIYKITTPSGYTYYGKAWNIKARISNHKCKPVNKTIAQEIQKYGADSLEFTVLVSGCPEPWASYYENKFIRMSGDKNTNKNLPNYKRRKYMFTHKDNPYHIRDGWKYIRIIYPKGNGLTFKESN